MRNKEAAHGIKAINTLKVLLIATSYPTDMNDWRGLFIRQLADALARRKDLQLSLWAPPGERAIGIQEATTPNEARWLAKLMQSGGIAHTLRNTPLRGGWMSIILLRNLYRAYGRHADQLDLLHCNWLQTLLPAPRKLPVLVTVLGTDFRLLRFPLMPALLRWRMRKRPIVICPNADWMAEPLQKLFGQVATIQTIPFGIDAPWFKLERQVEPESAPRWLVVTRLTHGKLGPLFEWAEPLFNHPARELHLFGPMQELIDIPTWVHYHGSATPKELWQTWFPQAHGLITLSRHSEGRPQIMLEAMAARVPSAG